MPINDEYLLIEIVTGDSTNQRRRRFREQKAIGGR